MGRCGRLVPLLLILLNACTGRGPDALLTGEPCVLPCWRNIRPGQTTESEALAALRGMQDVDRITVEVPFIYFGYDEHRSNRYHVGQDGVVDWIELELEATNLSQAVGTFGEPSYILIQGSAEVWGYQAFLPTKGLIVTGPCSRSFLADGWAIGPRSGVSSIYASTPDQSIDEMLELLHGKEQARAHRRGMIPWTGYGTYNWPD